MSMPSTRRAVSSQPEATAGSPRKLSTVAPPCWLTGPTRLSPRLRHVDRRVEDAADLVPATGDRVGDREHLAAGVTAQRGDQHGHPEEAPDRDLADGGNDAQRNRDGYHGADQYAGRTRADRVAPGQRLRCVALVPGRDQGAQGQSDQG